MAVLSLSGIASFCILWITLPNIDDPQTLFAAQSTVIYDRNGTELYRLFSEQDRTYVPLDRIADSAEQATIAIEDERFFERGCFDAIGFTRAVLSQIFPRQFVRSGGSTLTQQFAKNALVGNDRTLLRKARELLLACKLEHRYDKNHLLELYLNWIPYGKNAYGIEQASKNYFGISADTLTVAQGAILGALAQRPSYLNPYGPNVRTDLSATMKQKIAGGSIASVSEIPDRDIRIGLLGQTFGSGSQSIYLGGRTDQVLKNMLDQEMITRKQYEQALIDVRTIAFSPARETIRAPHFVLWIEQQVQDLYGLTDETITRAGLKITTTLDWNIQQKAEAILSKHQEDIRKRFGAYNAALLSVFADTREVAAYVGNIDYSDTKHEGKIDMVRAPRQPGSSFKPFVYAAAFEKGYGPGSVVYDVETKFGENTPQNYGGDFWGLMTMRSALAGSRNIPAIKAFFLAGGEETILSMATSLGVETPTVVREEERRKNAEYEYGYPLAIGSAEVPLYEMVGGYSVFASGGMKESFTTILKVTDRHGNILPLPERKTAEGVLDPRIAAEITSILSDAAVRPNDYWKSILSVPGFQAAAKTGTSNKCLEFDERKNCKRRLPESAWTIGYTPNLVTGVWVGNATSAPLYEKADGLTTAAPLWRDFMIAAHQTLTKKTSAFSLPAGLSQPLLSRLSGELAGACTPIELRQADIVLSENIPTAEDSGCVLMKVDKVTGLLPSAECPADAVEERAFFVPTSEKKDRWPEWERAVQAWAKKQMEQWSKTDTHSGSLLPLPLPPTEACDPAKTPGRLNKPTVRILSPQNISVPYTAFQPKIQVQSVSSVRQVEYFVDEISVGTDTEFPFDGSLRVPRSIAREGTHSLKVRVTDQFYNTAEDESAFTFGEDASGPSVTLVSPANDAVLPLNAPVQIRAEASDSAGIDRVEFSLDGKLLTIKRVAPYEFSFAIPTAGPHVIRATARDGSGNESSDEVSVLVNDESS